MPTKSIMLTDVAEGVWSETVELRETAGLRLAGGSHWSIRKRTLHGGVSDGVDVVDLNNGAPSVSILPTRGMGLWRRQLSGHRCRLEFTGQAAGPPELCPSDGPQRPGLAHGVQRIDVPLRPVVKRRARNGRRRRQLREKGRGSAHSSRQDRQHPGPSGRGHGQHRRQGAACR